VVVVVKIEKHNTIYNNEAAAAVTTLEARWGAQERVKCECRQNAIISKEQTKNKNFFQLEILGFGLCGDIFDEKTKLQNIFSPNPAAAPP
jgi:hypothetical protein